LNLRAKLALFLVIGTSGFLASTALVRGAVERRAHRMRCESDAESALQGALTEINSRSALQRSALDLWVSAFDQPGGATAGLLERRAPEGLEPKADEAVLLVSPAGDVVAASGGLVADSFAGLAEALRRGGVVGRSGPDGGRAGLVRAGETPIIAASAPLSGVGHATGGVHRLVVARAVDVTRVVRADVGSVAVHALAGDSLPPRLERAASSLWEDGRGDGSWFDDEGALAARVLEDALDRPAFLLSASVPMPDVGLVPAWAREALVWEAVAAFLAIAIALRFLDRRVLGPVRSIEERARQLARSEHGAFGFLVSERGEIGQLVDALESMLARVRDERVDLLKAALGDPEDGGAPPVSRDACAVVERARAALDAVSLRVDSAAVRELRAMADALEGYGGDLMRFTMEHPDGRFLAPFLSATADSLEEARAASLDDLTAIGNTLEHVVTRANAQRGGAEVDLGAASADRAWDVAQAVDHAHDVARVSFGAPAGLVVERAYSRAGVARIDRDRFTTALVQLIGHTLGELSAPDLGARVLRLRAYAMDQDRFVVEVEDSGPGIHPDDIHLAFTGEGGAGGALVVARELCRDLGVSIGVASDGPGRGTTYKLRVPYAPAARAVEAA